MTELREKVATVIDNWLVENDGCEIDCATIADAILEIPEIREALEQSQKSGSWRSGK